jgi:hypothetical protein
MKTVRFLILGALLFAVMGATAFADDVCQSNKKTYTLINTTTNAQLVAAPPAGQRLYVCGIYFGPIATATNVALVYGTGSICGTNTTAVFGGATAATGWNFGAGQGSNIGDGGFSISSDTTTAENLCILVSAANQVSGLIVTVGAP